MSQASTTISVSISDGIAAITLNRPKSLNAITAADYDAFANSLREIDKKEDVLVTVWQATGPWFSAGTDVKNRPTGSRVTLRDGFLNGASRTMTDCGHALYTHSKILVCALNGPVMGISAAFLGYFDFIYCMPNCWLALPFPFLGISLEGGASVSFVNRMGLARANEVLIWGKKKTAEELLACGFVNEILPQQSVEAFHDAVRAKLLDNLEGLDPAALLSAKKLVRAGLYEKNDPNAVNLRESYAQAERFVSGVPDVRFGRIARREIRHKL